MALSWTIKYKPASISEYIGNEKIVKKLLDFILNYSKQKKKGIIISGLTGSGKTSLVQAISKEYNLELVEINASDSRSQKSIEERLKPVLFQRSLFSKNKIVLVDEIDALSGTYDRGSISAITKLMKDSKFPIVFTTDDINNQKIKALKKMCAIGELEIVTSNQIFEKLKYICKNEKIEYEESALKQLARMCEGDIRSAINDIQIIGSEGKIKLDELNELSHRAKIDSMQNALLKVFKSKQSDIFLGAFDNVSEDLDKVLSYVEYNMPREYESITDIKNATEYLSLVDKFRARIRRWQYYRYYVYCYNFLSAGIALSKKEKYNKHIEYKQTNIGLKVWMANNKLAKKKAIAEKLAKYNHINKKEALRQVDLLKPIFRFKPEQAGKIVLDLELDEDQITWLRS